MGSVTDVLEFRLNKEIAQFVLNPEVVVGAIESPSSIVKTSKEEYRVEVHRLMGSKQLVVKSSSDAGGGQISCYDRGALRWSYTVRWSTIPGSATATLSFEFSSADDGLRRRGRRLIEELKTKLLNGRIEENYSRVVDHFKGEGSTVGGVPSQAQPASSQAEHQAGEHVEDVRLLEAKK